MTRRYTSKRVRELWWFGLPPGIRGTVWRKAIGNELNISQGQLFYILMHTTAVLIAIHSIIAF